VIEFLRGVLKIAGVDDEPSFTRSKLVNVNEEVQTVMQAATALDDEYVTRKVMTLLGDIDQIDEALERMDADELQRSYIGGENEQENQIEGQA
jgi:hypothetical protein